MNFKYKFKEKASEEFYKLANEIKPSLELCAGSPHRPNCHIPFYHNMAEKTMRDKIIEATIKSNDPEDIQFKNNGLEHWCLYCIVKEPSLYKLFPFVTRKIADRATKEYDKKYGHDT